MMLGKRKKPMNEMISFGAGVNSVAMTIRLVNEGWRGPIVFADTGGEHPETYCYLRYFEDWLKERGLYIERLNIREHGGLYDDKRLGSIHGVESLEDYCHKRGIIPLIYQKWCSVNFKRVPVDNWRKRQGIDIALVGISVDEDERRIHLDDFTRRYPLAEHAITRAECMRIIRRAGLDLPIKSSCFFCPGQNIEEFKRLYLDHPDLYERAIALEDRASEKNGKWATLKEGYSLRQMRERRWEGMIEMDLSEWLPCMCRL